MIGGREGGKDTEGDILKEFILILKGRDNNPIILSTET
jgi:hypothetical protein